MSIRLPRDVFVRTRSVDELVDAYERIYAQPRIVVEERDQLHAVGSQRRIGNVRIGYGHYRTSTDWRFPHADCFLYLLPVAGAGTLLTRAHECHIAAGRPATISPSAGYRASYDAAFEALSIKFDNRILTGILESMTGMALREPLVFAPQQEQGASSTPLGSYLALLVDTLEQTGSSALPDWWIAQTEHLLAVLLLWQQRHNYSHLFDASSPDPSVEQVRRTEAYIEANRHRPITTEDLGRAAGVSVLSLYRAFKKIRGCSPMQFAARLRRENPSC